MLLKPPLNSRTECGRRGWLSSRTGQKCCTLCPKALFALQEQQLGTGHAVLCAMPCLPEQVEQVVILCGDVPLIQADTIEHIVSEHIAIAATSHFWLFPRRIPPDMVVSSSMMPEIWLPSWRKRMRMLSKKD
jgi:hypothetical protein